jgi:hypothetical protein
VAVDSVGNAFVSSGSLTMPPANTAPPTISGTAQIGGSLTENHGTWTGTPTSYSYQWFDCNGAGTGCTAISAATNQSYTVTAADVGHTIEVQEVAYNVGGPSAAASSQPTGTITAGSTGTGIGTGGSGGSGASGSGGSGSGSGGSGDTGATTGAGGTHTPTAGQIKTALATALRTVTGKRATTRQILRNDGYKLEFDAPGAGTGKIDWYVRSRGKELLIASAKIKVTRSGRTEITIALNKAGKTRLKTNGPLAVRQEGSFTPTRRRATTLNDVITLRP